MGSIIRSIMRATTHAASMPEICDATGYRPEIVEEYVRRRFAEHFRVDQTPDGPTYQYIQSTSRKGKLPRIRATHSQPTCPGCQLELGHASMGNTTVALIVCRCGTRFTCEVRVDGYIVRSGAVLGAPAALQSKGTPRAY
jgi:hypothetical protein